MPLKVNSKIRTTLAWPFFFHSRVAHILNLVVQEGLATPEISKVKDDLKKMLQDILQSGKATYVNYMKLCEETESFF